MHSDLKPPTKHQRKKLENFLSRDERVVYVCSIGDRYFWLNLIMLFPFALILIGLPKLSHVIRMRQSYTYALTNKRFLIIRGLFSRKIVTAPLSAITHVMVEQSFAQRYLFNTGDLVVITAGFDQREIVIEHVGDPVKFKILIEELTDKLEENSGKETQEIRALS